MNEITFTINEETRLYDGDGTLLGQSSGKTEVDSQGALRIHFRTESMDIWPSTTAIFLRPDGHWQYMTLVFSHPIDAKAPDDE